MKLIDVDALKRKIEESGVDGTIANYVKRTLAATLDNEPTVDAVPVVRCKDCRKRNTNYCAIAWTESDPFIGEQVISEFYEPDDPDNWFCADGERADAHTCGTKLDGGELNDT